PTWVTSRAHLATVVMVRPLRTPAAATISTPWQTTATGLGGTASKKWRGGPGGGAAGARDAGGRAPPAERPAGGPGATRPKRQGGPHVVGRLLARDVPGDVLLGGNLVHHAVVVPGLGPGDDHLEAILGQAEERVEGVEHLGPIANGHEHFRHGGDLPMAGA